MIVKFADIRWRDIANGEGIRVSLFVSGCRHHCPGCFNEPYQDFAYGQDFSQRQEVDILKALALPYVKGLTLLGGEPFQNVEGLLPFLKKVKTFIIRHNQEDPLHPKNIWAFSGYLFEEILKDTEKRALLELVDVLVDGPFIQEELDLRLWFRGSANQRIIDVARSLTQQEVILLEKYI